MIVTLTIEARWDCPGATQELVAKSNALEAANYLNTCLRMLVDDPHDMVDVKVFTEDMVRGFETVSWFNTHPIGGYEG